MKIARYLLLLGSALAWGCASHPPSPSEEAPMELGVSYEEYEAEELEVMIVEEEELAPAPTPQPRENLSWEQIAALGETYTVAPGDTLSAIASRYDVGAGLLVRLNGLSNPDLIRSGQKLTAIRGPFRAEVNKDARTLDLFLGDVFIRSYPVTVGKNDSTPEGEFKVLRKMVNPAWTDPYNRTIVTADSPDYPLGTRWIEFKAPPGAYGIHGSQVAEEIGQEASFGCVRVLHPQEEELYDFLIPGSGVLIRK